MNNAEALSLHETICAETKHQISAISKLKQGRANMIAEGKSPQEAGATHDHALPLDASTYTFPAPPVAAQMNAEESYKRIFQSVTSTVHGTHLRHEFRECYRT
mmetsp:Transcript_14531/g.27919  ORF Transcript_14531/g.27919 Transcript_14531/m.27919 type:complete len:103 (+) Transcript_14531:144-452(+)|eukprot:CAMPEP_0114254162 /NCGR_PEP_ID=MMETSP0058-20121206/16821_1 /TAXON_ID=36894 /ORGANISM="Pyramimonas parkeae, CCMP726" /LENGTH=102 /DNA_ID=CAMNT_0001368341 /DNA_START=125 /DNA_END=433 /DNA_ORIENTATION=+